MNEAEQFIVIASLGAIVGCLWKIMWTLLEIRDELEKRNNEARRNNQTQP